MVHFSTEFLPGIPTRYLVGCFLPKSYSKILVCHKDTVDDKLWLLTSVIILQLLQGPIWLKS